MHIAIAILLRQEKNVNQNELNFINGLKMAFVLLYMFYCLVIIIIFCL